MLRWGMGFAGPALALAGVAEAQVKPEEIVGSWVCDAYPMSDPRGMDLQLQTNPVFEADGAYADEVFASVSGNSASGDAHTLSGRMSAKGTWTLNEDGDRLRYDTKDATLADLVIDGQATDPKPYQKQLIETVTHPTTTAVRIVSGTLEMASDSRSITCRRRSGASPS